MASAGRRTMFGLEAVLAAGVVFAFLPPDIQLFRDAEGYAQLHLLLELFAVVVSLLVFAIGWHTFDHRRPAEIAILASGFLGVAVLDAMHALSYQGMPRFVTDSSPEKAIAFWFAARTLAAVTLLAVALHVRPRISRYSWLALSVGLTAAACVVGLFYEETLPRTMIPGVGLTAVKIGYEYLLTGSFGLAAWLLLRRARHAQLRWLYGLASASFIMGLGEIFFSRYVAVSDLVNLLGHLYKVVAYLVIYQTVYLSAVRDPYEQARSFEQGIRELNASLERKVEERTSELKATLEHLRNSQEALVHAEKLAALGRLVAGVAHELNTPIGNGLLSATTLAEHTERFASLASAGELRRSALEAYMAQSREGSQILVRNLSKAADLIRSFKQVASDQASFQRKTFALKELVDDVLIAHHPMLGKSPIKIATEIPAGLQLDSYSGPLGQVIGNLITNAVLHGYERASYGRVTVSAHLASEDQVEIAVRDGGCGISEHNLKRVFDPFFTTRLGRGGSGLGLSISHSLVTQVLGGEIRIESTLGVGTTVIVSVPRTDLSAAILEAA